jgi:hypothetical protein
MSMNDVIDRIATTTDKNLRNNVLMGYCGRYGDNLLTPEEERTGLSSQRIYELNQELYTKGQLHPPRLSVDEINVILSDYPYQLPIEFYELYQRGNGFVPIGLGDKDWNCYYNYTMLPGTSDLLWSPLHEAMAYYKELHQIYTDGKLDPKILPLMSFERCLWTITGSEIQQSTSPVFRFYTDDVSHNNFNMYIACNNLTEMINNMSSDDFDMGTIWNITVDRAKMSIEPSSI